MKVVKSITNSNSNLPISMALFEINSSSSLKNNERNSFEEHFNILKNNNFVFIDTALLNDEIKYSPTSNYLNYTLSKILVSYFRKISSFEFFELLEIKIKKWAKVYNIMITDDLNWFIKVTTKEINSDMKNYEKYYIFDLDTDEENEKRHPYFSLYEIFVSFIFWGHKTDNKIIGYGLLNYG